MSAEQNQESCPKSFDQELEEYDHEYILGLMAEKEQFELFRSNASFQSVDIFKETIVLFDEIIQLEISEYERRYTVNFEKSRALPSEAPGNSGEPGQDPGNADQIFA